MKIEIKYGLEFEKNRIKYTLNKKKWYIDNGYNPKLPDKTSLNSKEKNIFNALKKEFNEKEYEVKSKEIKGKFGKVNKSVTSALKNIPDLELPKKLRLF